jgi:MoaA/NifB/PqqE/SkfB family radical SAM enzyme|tara:strand:+ start:1869 stop:2828 length:960 start_codon:yes stop_codon:yes gene_type:complete
MPTLNRIIPAKEKWLSIVWQVNDFCNFRCSYCNYGNWGGRYKHEDDIDKILTTLDYIIDLYQERGYKYFKLFLSGGEPTLWPGLVPTIELFREKVDEGSCVGVNTNLSRGLKWWKEHYHLFDDIVASYHAEWTKDDKYFENYEWLCTRINYLCARVMMHKEKWDQCIAMTERLKECTNHIIDFVPVLDELRPTTEEYHYDEDWQIEFFKSNPDIKTQNFHIFKKPNYAYAHMVVDGKEMPIESNMIMQNGWNFWRGWECNIQDSLHIYPDGRIRQASCGVGPLVGNIAGEFDSSNIKPVICPKHHCHCAADFNITKGPV